MYKSESQISRGVEVVTPKSTKLSAKKKVSPKKKSFAGKRRRDDDFGSEDDDDSDYQISSKSAKTVAKTPVRPVSCFYFEVFW